MFQVALLPRNLAACEVDLNHADPKVRVAVLKDLVQHARENERDERITLAISALSDAEAQVRRQALLALADFEARPARDRVLELLRDPEILVRQMAIVCLGEIAEPSDTEVLGRLACLLRAGDPSLRYQALLAHSQLAPETAEPDLLVGISDSDPEVRELALRLVDEVLVAGELPISEELRERVRVACADAHEHVRLMAQLVCADLAWDAPNDALVAVVVGRLKTREPRDEQLAIALAGRRKLTAATRALERRAFGRFLFNFDPFRWVALGALYQLGHDRAEERLRRGLGSRNAIERILAVQTLGECAGAEAIAWLEPLQGRPERVDPEVLSIALGRLRNLLPPAE